MMDIQRVPQSQPRVIPGRNPNLELSSPPNLATRVRSSHLNIDTFSPVNQNGSFEFDRVLKCGYVHKRTRRTKAWKHIYLVLRPNYISIYKDQNEDKLRHKIQIADLTAVAFLKDPKQKRQNVFGLFTPSRNYHLEAQSRKDAEEWVDLIRKEARIEEEEEEMMLASPTGLTTGAYRGLEHAMNKQDEERRLNDERLGSSSPEPSDPVPRPFQGQPLDPPPPRRASHTIEYSGNEISDMSDTDMARTRGRSNVSIPEEPLAVQLPMRPFLGGRNASQLSGLNVEHEPEPSDPERVVWQGHLLLLKSIRGVRQWKDLWVVMRPRSLALYKNDSEYSPVLIISLSSVINVVEIDPLSKSKNHCLQVITEEKSYKFCAPNEDTLDKCLGAFKSLLAKRKDAETKSRVR